MTSHRPSWIERTAIAALCALVHLLGLSLRIRELGRTEWGPHGDCIPLWALWHETILMSIWQHRHCGTHAMISASRDGERVARLAKFFGVTPVRGSTSKDSLQATRRLIASLRAGHRGAITPAGPRGPRRRAQAGLVAIGRLSGCPIVPFGFEAERCWRLRSWDGFIIPKPFSRAVFVYGDPIRVPREGGSDAEHLARIQHEMDRVTAVAEGCFKSDALASRAQSA
jgi:lysophospholipid acyltransferase (LPLAT)-like uncharacterized protein